MKCPRCQTENIPNAAFCQQCGLPLRQQGSQAVGPSSSHRPSSGPSSRQPLPDSLKKYDLFEQERAYQQQQRASSEPCPYYPDKQPKKSSPWKIALITLGVLVLTAGLGIGGYFFGQWLNSKDAPKETEVIADGTAGSQGDATPEQNGDQEGSSEAPSFQEALAGSGNGSAGSESPDASDAEKPQDGSSQNSSSGKETKEQFESAFGTDEGAANSSSSASSGSLAEDKYPAGVYKTNFRMNVRAQMSTESAISAKINSETEVKIPSVIYDPSTKSWWGKLQNGFVCIENGDGQYLTFLRSE